MDLFHNYFKISQSMIVYLLIDLIQLKMCIYTVKKCIQLLIKFFRLKKEVFIALTCLTTVTDLEVLGLPFSAFLVCNNHKINKQCSLHVCRNDRNELFDKKWNSHKCETVLLPYNSWHVGENKTFLFVVLEYLRPKKRSSVSQALFL